MKKVLLFSVLIFYTTSVFCQVTGTSKTGKLIFKKDSNKSEIKKTTEAPAISLLNPRLKNNDSLLVRDEELEIKLKAISKNGIQSVKINDEDAEEIQPTVYSYKFDLDKGINEFLIVATDKANINSFWKFYINYKPDESGPSISIVDPQMNNNEINIKNRNKINLKAKINDESGIKEVTLNDYKPILINDNIFTFAVELDEGENDAVIKAEDGKGNTSKLEFNISNIIDLSQSKITLLEPILNENNEIKLKEKSISIRGKVNDSEELSEVTINNIKAAFISENEFYGNIKLKDGLNNVSIKIKDASGNVSEKTFNVVQMGDVIGPFIKILEPYASRGTEVIHKSEVIKVKGVAVDESGILEVTVNNRKADLLPNGEFSIDMYLDVGNNKIIVKAKDNKLNSSADTFFVIRKVEEMIKRGKYYALIIGIDKYRGSWHELKNAVNDAKAVEEVIKNNYYFDEITTLYDEDATRRNIIQRIEWLEENVKNDDNVLIFYSGHGEFKENQNRGYWVPVDATSKSSVDFISNPDIQTYLNGISAKHTLLIADACFSGDIFKGRTESTVFEDSERYFKEVYRRASRTALTSGGIEPVTDGGRDGHSVFTYYLLKTLKGNSAKYFTAGQLFDEIKIPVTNNSEQRPNYQPIKNTGDEGGEFIFLRK
jgi:hypothetical protein